MTIEEPRYKLNRNAGQDTLHAEQTREECNADDAEGLTFVDEMTAEAMLLHGDAVACKHCQPKI